MLPKPTLLKVPNAAHSLGNYLDPACNYYSANGPPTSYFSCSPYQGGSCVDATYSPPDDGCSWGVALTATVVGGVIGAAIAVAAPT